MADTAQHIAVYTGVFDPVHLGHLDVIRRGARLVNRLVVGVGDNPEKTPLFNQEERVALLKRQMPSQARRCGQAPGDRRPGPSPCGGRYPPRGVRLEIREAAPRRPKTVRARERSTRRLFQAAWPA